LAFFSAVGAIFLIRIAFRIPVAHVPKLGDLKWERLLEPLALEEQEVGIVEQLEVSVVLALV
jgi:hypothetical protein